MAIRPTQSSTFALVRLGLMNNFAKLASAQEQVASGKRILRPSDDPVGASQALGYRNRLSAHERFLAASQNGQTLLDTAASNLQNAGELLAGARATLLQAMNGTQTAADRQLYANELRLIRDHLLSIGNAKSGGPSRSRASVAATRSCTAATRKSSASSSASARRSASASRAPTFSTGTSARARSTPV
jgi:flagellin-like hook-associated protein FlgL